MVETLLDRVGGIHLKGGPISEEKYTTYLQGKVGSRDNNYSLDSDCIDCGDCDCDDCPV